MLDSSVSADSQQPLDLIDDHFLSAITTLFIEEMAMDRSSVARLKSRKHPDHPFQLQLRGNTSISPVPCSKQTEAIALKEFGTRKAQPNHMMRRSHPDRASDTIRTFILGLSDAFNNLMMGIWGNLSLISMTGDMSSSAYHRVSEMEHMIQTGSPLINAVFGYLGERRAVAKNIRFNQLIREINSTLPVDGDRIKKDILQDRLAISTAHSCLTTMASNLSKVLKQFLERLQHQYDLILLEKDLDKRRRARLHTIARLVDRAWGLLKLLDRYAGCEPLNIKKISPKKLISKLARKFEKRHPHVDISLDLAPRLPVIQADRNQLQFVINQLLDNAVNAMPVQGSLHIGASILRSEPVQNRCVARRWSESIVITVSDTGHGMDLNTLLHVFDPFFAGRRKSNHLGMGLAAAWGIAKSHGGYIHVRSKLNCGTAIKILFPICHIQ